MTPESFLKLLFDPDEATCLTVNPRGTRVYPVAKYRDLDPAFFSINPIDPSRDHRPPHPWYSPDQPRRADCNVTVFRNILIELDHGPIDEQAAYVVDLGMPFSTAVFSGGKSVHFIVSLVEPLPDAAAYGTLVRRILSVVSRADKSVKNPSRLSRFPGHIREDSGEEQTLLEVGHRIPNAKLEAWLNSHDAPPVKPIKRPASPLPPAIHGEHGLNGWTRNFLMFGADPGTRNSSIFKTACNFREAGFSVETAIERMRPTVASMDFPESEFLRTVESAYGRGY